MQPRYGTPLSRYGLSSRKRQAILSSAGSRQLSLPSRRAGRENHWEVDTLRRRCVRNSSSRQPLTRVRCDGSPTSSGFHKVATAADRWTVCGPQSTTIELRRLGSTLQQRLSNPSQLIQSTGSSRPRSCGRHRRHCPPLWSSFEIK